MTLLFKSQIFLCNNNIIPEGGSKIELGANWIHGILGNPLYELAVSHNLVEVAQVSLSTVYCTNNDPSLPAQQTS